MAAGSTRPLMPALSPARVLRQVADAIPASCRGNVIIIGSLAAAYHFFGDDGERPVRTKDVDAMFSPHAKAVDAACEVTEELLRANWTPKFSEKFPRPGTAKTPTEKLPRVRLMPPGQPGWSLELLGAPAADAHLDFEGRNLERLITERGAFSLASFRALILAQSQPIATNTGLKIARPEMMALANLLHHDRIREETMSGDGRKRSNKDLGRVLALAHLQIERNRAEFEEWAERLASALIANFPLDAAALAQRTGSGLRALLASPADLDEATWTCNVGLLASRDVSTAALAATGRRVIAEVIDPLAERFRAS